MYLLTRFRSFGTLIKFNNFCKFPSINVGSVKLIELAAYENVIFLIVVSSIIAILLSDKTHISALSVPKSLLVTLFLGVRWLLINIYCPIAVKFLNKHAFNGIGSYCSCYVMLYILKRLRLDGLKFVNDRVAFHGLFLRFCCSPSALNLAFGTFAAFPGVLLEL